MVTQTYPSGETMLMDLFVDGDEIYWDDYLAGVVYKMPRCGGTPTLLAAGVPWVHSMVFDHDWIYFLQSVDPGSVLEQPGFLRHVSRQGGPVTTLVDAIIQPSNLALHGGRLYWSTYGNGIIESATTEGLDRQTIVSGLDHAAYVTASDAGLLWADISAGSQFWRSLGEQQSDSFALDAGSPTGSIWHGQDAYLTTGDINTGDFSGALVRWRPGSGQREVLFEGPYLLTPVIASAHLYWTSGATLLRMPLSGGQPVPLAQNINTPRHLAVDDEYVYWTCNMGLFRAPR